MFRMDKWFKIGWIYFFVMFLLEMWLPEWTGNENSIIENLQMLWLVAGILYCFKMRRKKQLSYGGEVSKLWCSGIIYYFLLFMREISWGRVLFTSSSGGIMQYSEMGLYGKIVHPLVGCLILIALVMLYYGKLWRVLSIIKLPIKSFVLLLLFIFMSWVGERTNFTGFHGQVAEELAEFGAYMMMFYITRDLGERMQRKL